MTGYGVNIVNADLYGDGKQEIVALTTQNFLVFTQGAGGLTQVASASIDGGSDLLVADTDEDGKAEVYVLAHSQDLAHTMLLQFDNTLKETNASVVGPYVSGPPASISKNRRSFTRTF